MRFRNPLVLLLALVFGSADAALAQPPDLPWRTLSTPHFRVHYPAPAAPWARDAAARLESVRTAVGAEVGWVFDDPVDVVVADPLASANGSAWPLLGKPRLVLWTTPPGPGSELGNYRDWTELLLVHEVTHLGHLLRPSRNPLAGWASRLLPLGPITRKAPRWAVEGYATVVEGRLTGAGRPASDLRASLLRRLAAAGRLPGYGALASDRRSWMGMSMAYLAGSAYLEWLEARDPEAKLPALWARLTARHSRSFDEAFEGVFGDPPDVLWDRFRAELAGAALDEEAAAPEIAGDLWQDLSWTTGPPALSPDGSRLAVVLRGRDRPSRLVVLATAPASAEEAKREEAAARLHERDPEDVPARLAKPPRREPLAEMASARGVEIQSPRFLPDGAILFGRLEPDADGVLHADLFRWDPAAGPAAIRRLTRGADIRDADPEPGGRTAIAVRQRWGLSQLVRVELATGAVTPLSDERLAPFASPRAAPDGRVAWLQHDGEGGGWAIVVREASGESRPLPLPAGSRPLAIAWRDGEHLVASLGRDGHVDLWELALGAGDAGPDAVAAIAPEGDLRAGETLGAWRRRTRTRGAALAPAPGAEATFFLALEPGGYDLRRLPADAPALAAADPPLAGGTAPAMAVLRPAAHPAPPLAAATLAPGADRPYGVGRLEPGLLGGGSAGPGGGSAELGARLGDVVGRLDLLALGALGDGAAEGGGLTLAWRGPGPGTAGIPGPLTFGLVAYGLRDPALDGAGDHAVRARHAGAALDVAWEPTRALRLGVATATFRVGALAGRVEDGVEDGAETIAGVEGGVDGRFGRGRFTFRPSLGGNWADGRSGEDRWRRDAVRVAFALAHDDLALELAAERRSVHDATSPAAALAVGGVAGTLLPRLLAERVVEEPALAPGTLLGARSESQNLRLRGALPVDLRFARHRVDGGAWQRVAAVETRLALAPTPILGLPGAELWIGVARRLDREARARADGRSGGGGRDTAWIALRWRP